MTLRKTSIALATAVAALAGTSALDSASAQRGFHDAGDHVHFGFPNYSRNRAPQTGQSTPRASSRQGNTGYSYGAHAYHRDVRGMRGRR
jgi:hypothetical protein